MSDVIPLADFQPKTPETAKAKTEFAYAELAVTTNFSFLRGASHPGDFVARAAHLNYAAIGIADRNSVAGIVRAYDAWRQLDTEKLKELGAAARPKLLVGARLAFRDGTPDILAYPRDRAAYGRLCQLLSKGKLRAPKGDCLLDRTDLPEFRQGLLLIIIPPYAPDADCLKRLLTELGPDTWLAASMLYTGDDRRRFQRIVRIARAARCR